MEEISQQRLYGKDIQLKKPYSYGAYNKANSTEQWIRLSEGCPHNCPFCYEPTEIKLFSIPPIIRNHVKIMDMNLLCKPDAIKYIRALSHKRVNGKVVHYELICGIDHRFLTEEIACLLKESRFKNIRLAWDWSYSDQFKIYDAIKLCRKAKYQSEDLMVFMICNWKTSYFENLRKLDLCKVWNVKVADCYFDGQVSPNIIPIFWTDKQTKDFRKRVRKHNQIVLFKIDPQIQEL